MFAFGALFALAVFVAVLGGTVLLVGRMWEKPWSSLLLVAGIAALAFAPLLLTGRPVHARHPNNAGVQLAFIWMAELQMLYGIPLLVFPFAAVRWLVRASRPAAPHGASRMV